MFICGKLERIYPSRPPSIKPSIFFFAVFSTLFLHFLPVLCPRITDPILSTAFFPRLLIIFLAGDSHPVRPSACFHELRHKDEHTFCVCVRGIADEPFRSDRAPDLHYADIQLEFRQGPWQRLMALLVPFLNSLRRIKILYIKIAHDLFISQPSKLTIRRYVIYRGDKAPLNEPGIALELPNSGKKVKTIPAHFLVQQLHVHEPTTVWYKC
jgi:hypothetical protein